MTSTETSDEVLLSLFQRGDGSAFEALFHRYKNRVYSFLMRSTRDPRAAEDLLQEVFMRISERARDFEGKSKVSTWIFAITRNLCVDHSRKMSFRRHRSLDAPGGDGDGAPAVEHVRGGDLNPERRALSTEVGQKIVDAVDALPDDQREVFLLRQVEHMPFRDIAELVGVPENTVKSRMRYALERLQKALGDGELPLEEAST